MTAMAHAMLVMWSMLQSTIDHATERIIAHGPARRTYAYQSPQTRINDYTPTHRTARVHPNLCSPPNPFPQQTRSTNTRNKLTQPVVLFYPTHPTAPISTRIRFPPNPNAFGYCSLRPPPLGGLPPSKLRLQCYRACNATEHAIALSVTATEHGRQLISAVDWTLLLLCKMCVCGFANCASVALQIVQHTHTHYHSACT